MFQQLAAYRASAHAATGFSPNFMLFAAKSELQLTWCLNHPPWKWNNGQVQMSSLPTFKNVTELLTDWRVNNFEFMQIVEKKCTIEKWSNNSSGMDSGYDISTHDGIKAAHRNGPRLM